MCTEKYNISNAKKRILRSRVYNQKKKSAKRAFDLLLIRYASLFWLIARKWYQNIERWLDTHVIIPTDGARLAQ